MPVWPTNTDSQADNNDLIAAVVEYHTTAAGRAPEALATAPATWSLIGEHTDHAGGIVLLSLCQARVAAAISPRPDRTIHVTEYTFDPTTNGFQPETTTAPTLDDTTADTPNTATASEPSSAATCTTRAEILSQLVTTLIQRQLLSRETAGFDITLTTTIPPQAGIGDDAAIEVATALALAHNVEEIDSPPIRAKLAETCYQAATRSHVIPPLRAPYLVALRGKDTVINVVDYADYSITEATKNTHPIVESNTTVALLVIPPRHTTKPEELRRRRGFLDEAARAFGVESIRHLPDANTRVLDWLQARHEVQGSDGLPTLIEAQNWLEFQSQELALIRSIGQTLRGRALNRLYPALSQSQSNMSGLYQITGSDEQVAQLCLGRGAFSARSAYSGATSAVIAIIRHDREANFTADLSDMGLTIMPLRQGRIAELVDIELLTEPPAE